jgi:hypothetical protein
MSVKIAGMDQVTKTLEKMLNKAAEEWEVKKIGLSLVSLDSRFWMLPLESILL